MPTLGGRLAQWPQTARSAACLRLLLQKLRCHYRSVSVLHRRVVWHWRIVQDAIGDGGLYTLWAGLMLFAELMILLVLWKGKQWREASIDAENRKSGSWPWWHHIPCTFNYLKFKSGAHGGYFGTILGLYSACYYLNLEVLNFVARLEL